MIRRLPLLLALLATTSTLALLGAMLTPDVAHAARKATAAERGPILAATGLKACLFRSTAVSISTKDKRFALASPRSGGVAGCPTGDGSFLMRRASATAATWRVADEGSVFFCTGTVTVDKVLLDFADRCPFEGAVGTKLAKRFTVAANAWLPAQPGYLAGTVKVADVGCGLLRKHGPARPECTAVTSISSSLVTGDGTAATCTATIVGRFGSYAATKPVFAPFNCVDELEDIEGIDEAL